MVGNISADHRNQLFPWVQMSFKCIISMMWFLLLHKRIFGKLERAEGLKEREMHTHLGAVPDMGDWLFHFNSGNVKNDQSWYTSFPLWLSVTFLGQLPLCLTYSWELWQDAWGNRKLGVCKHTSKHKHMRIYLNRDNENTVEVHTQKPISQPINWLYDKTSSVHLSP